MQRRSSGHLSRPDKARSTADDPQIRRTARSLLIGAAIIALANTSCEPRAYNVESVEVDAKLHILPIGSRSVIEPALGSYYFFFLAANLISVDHYAKIPGLQQRMRFLYLEAHHDFLLDRTVKEDEILKGPFGTLYSTKECFYNSPLERGYSTVSDGSNGNGAEHEVPTELAEEPKKLPPLTSLSLIRIFRDKPQFIILPASAYVIVSANYEPDGRLGGLRVNKAQDGDIVIGDFNTFDESIPIATYGIPRRIDIKGYLASRRLTLLPSTLADFTDVVNEHYGYNKIIRQDKLSHHRVAISSRFLQPSVTPEETILNPACDARFERQTAAKIRTVQ